jgi:hypothetical protein
MLYASALGREYLTVKEVHTSGKDQRSSIFDLVSAVFGSPAGEELMRISYEVDETPDTVEQWLEANIHHLKDQEMIAEGYSSLSRSDEYIGYTYRNQYYTLWRYATALMVLGVSAAAGGKGIHARIMPPARWRKMGTYRKQKALRLGLTQKLSSGLHMPREEFRDTYMSPLSMLVDHDPLHYAREFSLDVDELNLILQDRARSQEVVKKVQAMEREAEKERVSEEKESRRKRERAAKQEKPERGEEQSRERPVIASREEKGEIPEKSQKTLFDGF